MLFRTNSLDDYQASVEFKVMIAAAIAIVICVAMGIVSYLQDDSSRNFQHSTAWEQSV